MLLVLLQQVPPDVPFVVPVSDPSQELFRLGPFVTFVIGMFVIPVLVSLLTKYSTHPFVKFLLTTVFAIITSAFNVAINQSGESVISKGLFVMTMMQMAFAFLNYEHLLKPSFDINARLAPNFGIGPVTSKVPQDVRRSVYAHDDLDPVDPIAREQRPPEPPRST